MKKFLALLLTLTMLAGCFAIPAIATAEEPTHLTVWVPNNMRIEDFETNFMTLWLEKEANVDLEFIVQSSGDDYKSKINTALCFGNTSELPDIIMTPDQGYDDNLIWTWAQAGNLLPLTEYYKDPELSKNIHEAYERVGFDYSPQVTLPDGNIYAVPMLNQSYGNEYPHKTFVSQTWLDKLNDGAMPTTTEEFYQLLKKVHDSDPNGNGIADEIGMLGTFSSGTKYNGWFPYLMNAFVYTGDTQYRTVDDGVVGLAYTTEAWKNGLKYIRQLFEEGLIASESLTIDDTQFVAMMNAEDQLVFSLDYYAPDMLDAGGDRVNEYVPLAPLTGPEGVRYATYRSATAKGSMFITANCKHPEAAFRVGDLMSSEYIGITQRWGQEGKEWDYVRNLDNMDAYAASVGSFPMSIITYHDTVFWGGTDITNESWRQTGPYVRQYGIACGVAIDPATTEPYTIMLNGAWDMYQQGGYAPAETIPKMILTTEESEQISEIEVNLKTAVDEWTANFVNGNYDIDAQWDEFQGMLKDIGADVYISVCQGVYDRMYK